MYRRQDVLFSEAPVNSDRISIFWSTKGIVLGNYVTHIEDSGEERKGENRKREGKKKKGRVIMYHSQHSQKLAYF